MAKHFIKSQMAILVREDTAYCLNSLMPLLYLYGKKLEAEVRGLRMILQTTNKYNYNPVFKKK